MTRLGQGVVCLSAFLVTGLVTAAHAATVDTEGDIKLGVRTYVAARIQAEHTDVRIGKDIQGEQVKRQLTFPVSPDGHLRQNRFFAEVEWDHELDRLVREDFGPLGLLKHLPFRVRNLRYHLVYRGEGEGIYDWGPSEFRTAEQWRDKELVPNFSGREPDIAGERRRLRRLGVQRQRLFQAFVDFQIGNLFVRTGRQILSWGETDAFRLLDNINPLDNSFGGFLIPLDERRVPLDMVRMSYYLGNIGPFSEMYVEGFGAWDDEVGYFPGIPIGSPWALPNLGHPSTTTQRRAKPPARTFRNARGGGQLKFNAPIPGTYEEVTLGFAYYHTFFDTPQVQSFVNNNVVGFPLPLEAPDPGAGFLARTEQRAPKVEVAGATASFTIPAHIVRNLFLGGELIVRTELAYFRNAPRHQQEQLDPFVYKLGPSQYNKCIPGEPLCTGGTGEGDSWNFVLGLDSNQFIRWLNPRQSFFFSAQFFYKHLNGASTRRNVFPGRVVTTENGEGSTTRINPVDAGEVLPVPEWDQQPSGQRNTGLSNLVHHPVDQYLTTLLISTQYYSAQINPSLIVLYDWSGSIAVVPTVQFARDPWRFQISYNFLQADRLKGASGVSLLSDRDNVLFQIEYVM